MNKSVDALVEDPDIIGTYVSTHCYKPPFSVQKFNQVNLNFSNPIQIIFSPWVTFQIFGAKIQICRKLVKIEFLDIN